MKKALIILLVTALLIGAAACTRTVYVPTYAASTDTAYIAKERVDTVAVTVDRLIERNAAGDTVRITELRDRWRVSLRRDTVYRIRADTVRVAAAAPAATPGGRYALDVLRSILAIIGVFSVCFIVWRRTRK